MEKRNLITHVTYFSTLMNVYTHTHTHTHTHMLEVTKGASEDQYYISRFQVCCLEDSFPL